MNKHCKKKKVGFFTLPECFVRSPIATCIFIILLFSVLLGHNQGSGVELYPYARPLLIVVSYAYYSELLGLKCLLFWACIACVHLCCEFINKLHIPKSLLIFFCKCSFCYKMRSWHFYFHSTNCHLEDIPWLQYPLWENIWVKG